MVKIMHGSQDFYMQTTYGYRSWLFHKKFQANTYTNHRVISLKVENISHRVLEPIQSRTNTLIIYARNAMADISPESERMLQHANTLLLAWSAGGGSIDRRCSSRSRRGSRRLYFQRLQLWKSLANQKQFKEREREESSQ